MKDECLKTWTAAVTILITIAPVYALPPLLSDILPGLDSGPQITTAYLDKTKYQVGDQMLITAAVLDDWGMKKVEAQIENENGWDTVDLILLTGSSRKGTWQGAWKVHDTLGVKEYRTIIIATDLSGQTAEKTLLWIDPVQSHPPEQIRAGTFQAGSYKFPDNVGIGTDASAGDRLKVNGASSNAINAQCTACDAVYAYSSGGVGVYGKSGNKAIKGEATGTGYSGYFTGGNGVYVDGNIQWTGTLQSGTVPWARLSGHPSITASGGLAGGGDLSTDRTVSIADGGVATAKIADSAVTSAKISDGTIATTDIADGAVTSAKIADGTIASGDVGFNYAGSGSKGGAATTALALSADGSNCAGGQYAQGVDASGNAQGCSAPAAGISGSGTANYVPKWTGGTSLGNSVIYDDGGNIGIGTVSPIEKLEVNGNIKATAFLYSSDRISKENIKKIDNPLEKIMMVDGVSFTWKESGEKGIGLTAQNVETVFPELVKTDNVSGMKSVEYGNLVAPLIEAVKEQQKIMKGQQILLDNLQNQIEALKTEIKK